MDIKPDNTICDTFFCYVKQFLIATGKYGSVILFLTTICIFTKVKYAGADNHQYILLKIYIFCFLLNYLFNIICKIILKQPRPKENLDLFHIVQKYAPWNRYGTPSTHVQSSIYTTTFISFTLKEVWITIPFLILSLNTMIQQVILTETYYAYQVAIGAILGIIVGYLAYLLSTALLKGDISEKTDDEAPALRGLL